jgi:hypothetical protein
MKLVVVHAIIHSFGSKKWAPIIRFENRQKYVSIFYKYFLFSKKQKNTQNIVLYALALINLEKKLMKNQKFLSQISNEINQQYLPVGQLKLCFVIKRQVLRCVV